MVIKLNKMQPSEYSNRSCNTHLDQYSNILTINGYPIYLKPMIQVETKVVISIHLQNRGYTENRISI